MQCLISQPGSVKPLKPGHGRVMLLQVGEGARAALLAGMGALSQAEVGAALQIHFNLDQLPAVRAAPHRSHGCPDQHDAAALPLHSDWCSARLLLCKLLQSGGGCSGK